MRNAFLEEPLELQDTGQTLSTSVCVHMRVREAAIFVVKTGQAYTILYH